MGFICREFAGTAMALESTGLTCTENHGLADQRLDEPTPAFDRSNECEKAQRKSSGSVRNAAAEDPIARESERTCNRARILPSIVQIALDSNMRRSILVLLGLLCALPVSAAPPSPLVGTEIAALLTRLETSGCEFNRNGVWYGAAEAKAHLELKSGAAGTFKSAEQFIERVASKSSMSGQPYLVRCEVSTPVRSGQWLTAQLKEIRASPLEYAPAHELPKNVQVQPEALAPDDPFAPPS
jgi:hypothetical protein